MSLTLQEFLVGSTEKAAADLTAAVLRLPEDKRAWSPMERGRTALHQAAECAVLNKHAAQLVERRVWHADSLEDVMREMAQLAQDWDAVYAALQQNTSALIAAIRAVPGEALTDEVTLPWGAQTLSQVMAYPYWNMSYHEGQINYIGSLAGERGEDH